MAHLIEQMAYANATPWHGLGNNISADSSIEEWQAQAGLNWSVSKRPVLFDAGTTNDGMTPLSTFKDKFVLVRDSDSRPFSVVSQKYKPVQPKQVLEFFRDLVANFGMKIETAGSLKDGQRIWALAKTGDAYKVMGVDKVDSYLMLATSYDLTFSTLAQFTSVRVVCNNTLQQSFKNHSARVSIPHFRDFDIKDIQNEMGVGRAQWDAFTGTLNTLSQIKLDVVKAKQIADKVFDINPELVTYENKHVDNVLALFYGRAIGADIAGQTGWGLVNAVTEYVDQHKRARGQGNRLDSAWFGEGFNLKQKAVDETLLLAA